MYELKLPQFRAFGYLALGGLTPVPSGDVLVRVRVGSSFEARFPTGELPLTARQRGMSGWRVHAPARSRVTLKKEEIGWTNLYTGAIASHECVT
jgi:hypothetical protein